LLYLRSFNRFILITLALLGLSISSASAALTSADWKIEDDDLLTIDDSGLQWLDLSETVGQSYNAVAAQLVADGLFEGFRYATVAEVEGLWDSAREGDNLSYDGWSVDNNGVFDVLAPFWGDTLCTAGRCAAGTGGAWTLVDLVSKDKWHMASYILDCSACTQSATQDFLMSEFNDAKDTKEDWNRASALVRVNPVPVPAAIWLFGTALIGLVGFNKRKSITA
jgi:hypothetical protein